MDTGGPGPFGPCPHGCLIVGFWEWFKSDGDRIFTFVSLASIALTGTQGVDPVFAKDALIAGVLATAAHNAFFPTPKSENPK